jgi:putative ABC transport system permease protein
MGCFGRWGRRLGALRRRRALDAEMDEEMRLHLELEAEDLMRSRGLSREEAMRAARVAFGGVERYREEGREARGVAWLEAMQRDVRLATRQLWRSPGFTAVIVLTLALGIGANAAIFSVVDGVLLRRVPFRSADRLVMLWETDRHSGTTREPGSWPDYMDYRRDAKTLDDIEALSSSEVNLTPSRGEPQRVIGISATSGYLRMVGIRPLLGRVFTADEDRPGGPHVVLLGESLWRSQFGGDASIVGRTIQLNDQPYTVVGVLPAGADFGLDQINAESAYHSPYDSEGEVGVWGPLQASESSYPRETHPLFLMARLAPGATTTSAQHELQSIAARLERTYPVNDGRGAHVEALSDVVFGAVRPALYLLLGAVALVLLVACVNVANLLLARGTVRAREVALRSTLGAGLSRIGLQFVTESGLIVLLGTVAGLGLAYLGLHALLALVPAGVPRATRVGINGTVLAATAVLSGVVALAFGMVPTLQAGRVDLNGTLKAEAGRSVSAGRGGQRLRRALVVAELALAVTLVVGAGLLIRSFRSVLSVDPGFRAEHVLKAQFDLPSARYPQNYSKWPEWKEIHAFDDQVLQRAAALPGVTAVALSNVHPLDAGFTNSWNVVGREAEARDWPEIATRLVTPGYFNALGVPLVRGRSLREGDDAASPRVAVVNQATVRRFFQKQDPIGQQIGFWGVAWRVVGVVGDEHFRGLTEAVPPAIYVPLAQAPSASGVLFVRTAGDPTRLAGAVQQVIHSVDPALAVFGVEPLTRTLTASVGERRFTMLVLGVFAAVALVLALVGVHGVLSYTVAQRRPEMGIRMALGATPRGVLGLVLRSAVRLTLAGTLLGLLGAVAASRLLRGLLFEVRPLDATTFLVVSAVVVAAALLASLLPALRATHVDPMTALRAE